MYCFRCGSILEQRTGGLYCASGDMHLSKVMELALTELTQSIPPQEPAKMDRPYGWYCPGCASPLKKVDAEGLSCLCLNCGLQLERPLVLRIIELHPHAN